MLKQFHHDSLNRAVRSSFLVFDVPFKRAWDFESWSWLNEQF